MTVKTIEQLAQDGTTELEAFGEKAQGLVLLHKAREDIRADDSNKNTRLEDELHYAEQELQLYQQDGTPQQVERAQERLDWLNRQMSSAKTRYAHDFDLTPAFAISADNSLEDYASLKQAYGALVTTPLTWKNRDGHAVAFAHGTEKRIVLARSSAQDEAPGKYATHFSVYDPADPEGSFHQWLNNARKVRESGAQAIIGDVLAATNLNTSQYISMLPDDEDWFDDFRSLLEESELTNTTLFGVSNTSFVATSANMFSPNLPSVSCVVGLPSKIVRGDDDYSYLQLGEYGFDMMHTKASYTGATHYMFPSDFPQQTMDVVDFQNGELKTIRYGLQGVQLENTQYGGAYAWPRESMHMLSFFDLVQALKTRIGTDIEIEGTFPTQDFESGQFPYLVQLRTFQLPQNRLQSLTEVEESQIMIQGESFVADAFSGDLVVLHEPDLDSAGVREKIGNSDYVLMDQTYNFRKYEPGVSLEEFKDRVGLVVPIFYHQSSMSITPHEHTFGHMSNLLLRLQKQGPVIALETPSNFGREASLWERLTDNVERYRGFSIVRGATVESNGKQGQIYV